MKSAQVVKLALASFLLLSAHSANAITIVIDVTANIDGRDQLIIQNNTLTWHHFEWTAVGLHNSLYPSTIISTTLDGVSALNGQVWTPTWPNGAGYGAYSSTFTGLFPAVPSSEAQVTLQPVQVRAGLSLVESPSSQNGFSTIVEFNDNPVGSDANYRARITISAIPEPASSLLFAAAAFAGLLVPRFRKAFRIGCSDGGA